MVGATTCSAQTSKEKKAGGTSSWLETPQPGALQQQTADDSEHIIYDVTTAKSVHEHLLKNLTLTEDSPTTIEALHYTLLCMAETS